MVFGLMITAAICAPRTRVWVFVWYVVRAPRLPETTALVFCLFYLALIVLQVVGYGVPSDLGPFAVALVAGAVFALVMRKAAWVNGRKTAEVAEEAGEQTDEAGGPDAVPNKD